MKRKSNERYIIREETVKATNLYRKCNPWQSNDVFKIINFKNKNKKEIKEL